MSDPVIAQKSPYPVEVVEGKKYFWCSCGKSARQPFCDGSHEGTDFLPQTYTAPATRTLYFSVDANTQKAHRCVMARTTRCLTLRG